MMPDGEEMANVCRFSPLSFISFHFHIQATAKG